MSEPEISKDEWEQFCEIMRENDKEIMRQQAEYDRVNSRLFRAIASVKSPSFLRSLKEIIQECDGILGKARITRKPEGSTWQKESHGREIKGIWITQTTGFLGDDFSGVISVKIRKNRYFTFDYAC